MVHYLIEFRFHGKAKYEIKRLVYDINRRFRLGYKRAIPHITLAGPLYTNDEKRLIGDFNRLCTKSPLMNFEIDGFSAFENSEAIYLDVKPSKELEEFRWNLSQTLKPYCRLRSFDYKKKFAFHATIAMKLSKEKFYSIRDYINRKANLNFKHVMVRATLLKGGLILREYDFLLRRPLVRKLAKDKRVYSQTLDLLKGHFENKFNPNEFREERIKIEDKSVVDKIKSLFRKPKTFITSDLHLDHTNIIKYCKRPFLNKEDMNKTLVNNWNNIISNKDTVYFLGDLAYGRGSKNTNYWLKQLNGKIIFIKGNHDKSDRIKFHETYVLEYGGYKFFLSHEPEQVPKDWDGWAICGHHHNHKLEEYPFINKKNKIINVSTELTKFRPVDMDELIKKIED
ncbi:MAG: 2'-5' RNA ligase family protein [Candidatus Woesearchaeota archaeon]